MWEIINKDILNKNKNKKSISLKINNIIVHDKKIISNEFNKYFANVANDLQVQYNLNPNINNQPLKNYEINTDFTFEPTCKHEIETIIKNLNSKSAVGNDRISIKFSQKYAEHFS